MTKAKFKTKSQRSKKDGKGFEFLEDIPVGIRRPRWVRGNPREHNDSPTTRMKNVLPTKKGSPIRSSWLSRVHLKVRSGNKHMLACQRNSRTRVWKRDIVSVPSEKKHLVTCGRCILVIRGMSRSASK